MPLPAITVTKTLPLVIKRGQTTRMTVQFWQDRVNAIPANLTGVTVFTAKVRDSFPSGTSVVLATLTCTCPTPTNGQVIIALTVAQSLAIAIPSAPVTQRLIELGPWDFEMGDGTDSFRYLEGQASISLEASF